jgi:predicted permease
MLNDIRFAVRQLLKAPAFSVVAVVTLGLGIGINSALFTVVNSILFRPPGYHDPATLVDVYETSPNFRYGTTSYPNYVDLRDQNTVFSGVALYRLLSFGFARGEVTQSVWAEVVSGNYFEVLAVPAAIGRTFDPAADDVAGAAPTVVLSHPFWVKEFGADPRVIGTSVRLNGVPFQIVGVASPAFRGMVRGLIANLWVTAGASSLTFPGSTFLTDRANHGSFVRARLKPGVGFERAVGEVDAIGKRLATVHPVSNAGRDFVAVATGAVTVNPGVDGMVAGASLGVLAIPAMVLLIACANLATLFLTRAAGRKREIAVRTALGAARGQVVRQLLAESLLLSAAGGALGLLICVWLSELLVRFQPPIPLPISLDIQIDWRVIAFTAGTAIVTGVLFGLAPALRASRPDLISDLREGTRGSSARSRLRSGLVAVQLAVSVVLLVGSALLIRSLAGAGRVDLGFKAAGAATLTFDPSQQGYDGARTLALVEQLIAKVRLLPSVMEVSATTRPPLNLNVSTNEIVVEGAEPVNGRYPEIQRSAVGPAYFATIGAAMAAGREFSAQDRPGQPPVVIVNEAAAAALWPGHSPIGKRVATRGSQGPGTWREVVGVVKNIKVVTIGEPATPQIFFPLYSSFDAGVTLVARTRGDPAAAVPALRQALRELDAGMPVMGSGPLLDLVATALFPIRFTAILLVVLGLGGLAIASIGLYGMIAQAVAARTRELGIRLALGAEPGAIQRAILADGLRLTAVGLAIGLVVAALASRVLSSWLYGVTSHDLVAFSAAPLVLLLVAVISCLVPARRATRVDPVEALRAE